ncbi:MAG: hypothetical protein KGV57_01315 [Fusobacterium sp.]|nr:hypothetical protein [Fusobacterium sp.]
MKKKYSYVIEKIVSEKLFDGKYGNDTIEEILNEYGEKGYRAIIIPKENGEIQKIIFELEEVVDETIEEPTLKPRINDIIIDDSNRFSNTLKDKLSLYMSEYDTGNIYVKDINILQFKNLRNVGRATYNEFINLLKSI